MGIKTEDFVKNLPPKEMTEGVDWIGILESFDPKAIDERFINECARRNQWDTCYKWDTPSMPIEERLSHSEAGIRFDRRDLEGWAKRIETEGLNASLYKNARMTLIKAIGSIGAHEYNLREYESLGQAGRKKQAKEYKEYEEEREAQMEPEEEYVSYQFDFYEASMPDKIHRIRKSFFDSKGKPLTQRDFAKFLEYPINQYIEAENAGKGKRRIYEEEPFIEDLLLERLIFRCHANPYWLYDYDCEPYYGSPDSDSQAVLMGDEPCIFASPDIILKWIKEGKSRNTSWFDTLS